MANERTADDTYRPSRTSTGVGTRVEPTLRARRACGWILSWFSWQAGDGIPRLRVTRRSRDKCERI